MTDSFIISEIEKDHIISLLEQNKRIDGRGLKQYREITIQTEYVEKAEGSAVINMGNTKIIVGVKAQNFLPLHHHILRVDHLMKQQ